MRLSGLCLALLCAAGAEPPRAARERPPGLGAAAGWAAAATGRGGPGAAGVDPRQAWMLLAGSPGRGSGGRARGGPGADTAPAGGRSPGKPSPAAEQGRVPGAAPDTPAVPVELLRELQILLRGTGAGVGGQGGSGGGTATPRHSRAGRRRLEKWRFFPNAEPRWGLGSGIAKEQAKVQTAAWEEHKEEEERSPQAGVHHRVNAAFHCRTREDISVGQRTRQELQLFYIPEREEMFHRGLGLNLTSGQYTAPIAGYYTFTTTLHIVHREPPKKRQVCRGTRLRVLICVQSRCQHNRNLETSSRLESRGDLFTISVTGVLYLQAGQYASVFVENAAGSPLTVRSGSDFSAVLLGV
ncbi:erythroferrone [Corapipo altera]|uniref:erythroferrone n=1 Tax=Corapipo altera TaxID=415028 RepID=UPI000FD68A2C|nr:erythroferrone [Corapipo altera]